MKKYEMPILEEQKVEIEDVVAASFGANEAGDVEFDWPWVTNKQ